MISDKRLEQALTFISETDEQEAALKTDALRCEHRYKQIKDAMFLAYDVGSVAEKQARAANEGKTLEAQEEWLLAVNEHRVIDNKRKREAMIVDVWRSMNANRRAGNV